jgi:hypothetical protein
LDLVPGRFHEPLSHNQLAHFQTRQIPKLPALPDERAYKHGGEVALNNALLALERFEMTLRKNPGVKMMKRPKGWVKADAVRVVRNKGKLVVEIRRKRKRNPAKKHKKSTRRKSARRKSTSRKRGR